MISFNAKLVSMTVCRSRDNRSCAASAAWVAVSRTRQLPIVQASASAGPEGSSGASDTACHWDRNPTIDAVGSWDHSFHLRCIMPSAYPSRKTCHQRPLVAGAPLFRSCVLVCAPCPFFDHLDFTCKRKGKLTFASLLGIRNLRQAQKILHAKRPTDSGSTCWFLAGGNQCGVSHVSGFSLLGSYGRVSPLSSLIERGMNRDLADCHTSPLR